MSTMELNAELFRQLSIIAEDETLMRKAVKAIRRLAQKKEQEDESVGIEKEIELSRKQYGAGNAIVCKTAEEAVKHLEAL